MYIIGQSHHRPLAHSRSIVLKKVIPMLYPCVIPMLEFIAKSSTWNCQKNEVKESDLLKYVGVNYPDRMNAVRKGLVEIAD